MGKNNFISLLTTLLFLSCNSFVIEDSIIKRSVDGEKVDVVSIRDLSDAIESEDLTFTEMVDEDLVIDMIAELDVASKDTVISDHLQFLDPESANYSEFVAEAFESDGYAILKAAFNINSPFDMIQLTDLLQDAGFGSLLKSPRRRIECLAMMNYNLTVCF